MARQQQRHHFIVDLLITHTFSRLFILSSQQEREHITPFLLSFSALAYDRIHDAIKRANCSLEATIARGRQVQREPWGKGMLRNMPIHQRERPVNGINLFMQYGTKKRLTHDCFQ
jgi:hypothetical protein